MHTLHFFFSSLNSRHFNLLLKIILLVGLFFRIFHFFYNRSLWIDEIYLSSSIIKFNLKELATIPLLYQQKAPIGFLLIVKLMVNTFGNSEISLRIFPLICGIASIFLFVPVAKHFLSSLPALLAISILCFSPALIYHSVEIKQYSTDLFAAILSLYTFIKMQNKRDLKSMMLWSLVGALTIWFSYSSIFVLAGIGIYLTINNTVRKNLSIAKLNLIPFGLWLISFIINYLLFTHKHAESKWIVYWFEAYNNFMPFPPKSISDVNWFILNLYRMMDYPLGLLWNFNYPTSSKFLIMALKMPLLPILLLFTGIFISFTQERVKVLILIIPIFITFLASGLKLYPLTERFWVFLSPFFIVLICKGFEFLKNWLKINYLNQTIALLLIFGPLSQAIISITNPKEFYVHKKSFQREVLTYVDKEYIDGDAVYVYWNNAPGYLFYKQIYHLKYNAIVGTDKRAISKNFYNYYQNLEGELNLLNQHKRFWVILNTQFITDIGDKIDDPIWYYKNSSGTKKLIEFLSRKNTLIKTYKKKDVSAYLFIKKEQ